MATPLEIEILLFYNRGITERFPRYDAPAVKEALHKFVEMGFLIQESIVFGFYRPNTVPIRMYVERLCKINFPEQKWEIPDDFPMPPPED